ncbi:Tripartite Motif-Containing Protein 77 [Manis pentadactyla]|nr:Tripartite Motif-Containing Protein 77 [Manis pentadactyla]
METSSKCQQVTIWNRTKGPQTLTSHAPEHNRQKREASEAALHRKENVRETYEAHVNIRSLKTYPLGVPWSPPPTCQHLLPSPAVTQTLTSAPCQELQSNKAGHSPACPAGLDLKP